MKSYTYQCQVKYKPESGLRGQWYQKTAEGVDRIQARLKIEQEIKRNTNVASVKLKFMY